MRAKFHFAKFAYRSRRRREELSSQNECHAADEPERRALLCDFPDRGSRGAMLRAPSTVRWQTLKLKGSAANATTEPADAGCDESPDRAAFTLIELLVVLAIIALLASFLLPVFSKTRETARGAACMSQLRQMGIALQLYVQGNRNRLPVMYDALFTTNNPPTNTLKTVDVVLTNYLGSPKVLRCPSDRDGIFEQTRSSYGWNVLINGQDADHFRVLNLSFDPHQIPIFFDKEDFHRARGEGKEVNYLYGDGHIKNLLVVEGAR